MPEWLAYAIAACMFLGLALLLGVGVYGVGQGLCAILKLYGIC